MNPTHTGSRPRGRRLHLTDERGWSACSRRMIDVTPIEQARIKVDDPWCGSCLRMLTHDALRYIRLHEPVRTRDGGHATAKRWDARSMVEIGELILDWLDENPAPEGSTYVRDLEFWGERLERVGRYDLEALDEADQEGGA